MKRIMLRGYDMADVARVEGRPGENVTLHFINGGYVTLGHDPGDGLYQKAVDYFRIAQEAKEAAS